MRPDGHLPTAETPDFEEFRFWEKAYPGKTFGR
ncbi:hypothetical protein SAMN05443574_13516 [Haloarcula vallismortis]|uniref:Uncharacterized protein n=1 Tax=Haloarcula vallismortis TaxID=28442 RepID=A0A1H3B0V9_HALVA|nr:hypothetical protein SAMN05443574_13516 [Haloarcula vallismortis]